MGANPPPEEDRQDIPSVELDILDMALPKAPRPVTLEDMVGSTVDAVMEGNSSGSGPMGSGSGSGSGGP